MGASACHIAVSQEFAGLLIVRLHRSLLLKLAVVIQAAEKFACRAVVYIGSGAGIHIERYSQLLHSVLDDSMVAVHDILRGHTLGAGLDGDRHTMFVTASHHHNILSALTQIACVDIGGYIHSGQMSYVDRSVCIR